LGGLFVVGVIDGGSGDGVRVVEKSWEKGYGFDGIFLLCIVEFKSGGETAKPPIKNDWNVRFQPMSDECFKPPSVVSTPIYVVTLLPANTARAFPSSTTIDKDAPSP
nr:hypothetical protein [Tanacetum cinerariifolium]